MAPSSAITGTDKPDSWERANWEPDSTNMNQVRIPALAAPLPDDPDKDLVPGFESGKIIYATIEGSRDVFLWLDGVGKFTVPSAFADEYTGIAVDPHFLWVFGSAGITCATHASVVAFVTKKVQWVRWHSPPNLNPPHVRDLSSCEDGTLMCSRDDRVDTALYHVDLKNGTLTLEEWERFAGQANASQVYKLPIFGWSLIERSVAAVA